MLRGCTQERMELLDNGNRPYFAAWMDVNSRVSVGFGVEISNEMGGAAWTSELGWHCSEAKT